LADPPPRVNGEPVNREAVEYGGGQVQPDVGLAIRGAVDVGFSEGDHAVMIGAVDAGDLLGVGVEDPFLEVADVGLEGLHPGVDVEHDLIREAAGDEAIAGLCGVVGVSGVVGVVAVGQRAVADTFGSTAWDQR
jgi:hypothetical protein